LKGINLKTSKKFVCDTINDAKEVLKRNSSKKQAIEIRLSKEDIRQEMQRKRIKQALLDDVKSKFEKAGCEVKECENDLCITAPYELVENKTYTLASLKKEAKKK
jgi:hypothetical protein